MDSSDLTQTEWQLTTLGRFSTKVGLKSDWG